MITKITSIHIEHIKGIENSTFALNIIPNKPSILVAPNGFGKSSFAIAFDSLQSNRINLNEDNCYKRDISKLPKLKISCIDDTGCVKELLANNTSNSIKAEFAYFVINNQLKAKAIGQNIGGRTNVSGHLAIESCILIDNIPPNVSFDYSCRDIQKRFGTNGGRVLMNIPYIFDNLRFIEELSGKYQLLGKFEQVKIGGLFDSLLLKINDQKGSTVTLKQWMNENILDDMKQIQPLQELFNETKTFVPNTAPIELYLILIQLLLLYKKDKAKFKNACRYSNYILEKKTITDLISAMNTSKWRIVQPKVKDNKLVIEFPRADQLSNGQRDILCFISLLIKARKELNKDSNILIIDEVFDYLDDSNLTVSQYYVTKFIAEYKILGKNIYPIILTHLNPYYFKNYAFKDLKIYNLNKIDTVIGDATKKLLRYRTNNKKTNPNEVIKIEKYLLHYHSEALSERELFKSLSLKETWGENRVFYSDIDNELQNYLTGNQYDPFLVCCAVRVKIEKGIFDQIGDPQQKTDYLEEKGTRNKLDMANSFGINVPELYYLLGIIYNDGLHWHDDQDKTTPLMSKLQNLVIKQMISEI